MKILGSLILLVLSLLAAELHVYVKKNPISLGEPAQLVIEASGDDIEIPRITKIAGYPVAGRSESESAISVNGNLTFKKVVELSFYPDQNVTIEPISVTIDGKEYKSEPIKLGVVKKIKKDDYVEFSLKANKQEAYVGEPIILDMVLKIRRGLHIVNYDFLPPKFDGFWVKEIKSSNKYLEEHGEYLIKRIRFLLLPQKPGYLTIAPAMFKYATAQQTTDIFGFSVTAPKWSSVVSNSLHITAKPLPKDVDLVGEFTIHEHVDKNVTKPNEPVNLTIVIEGEGNLENFSGIDLDIPNATVYEDKPKIDIRLKDETIHSRFTQHFSIIAAEDFTIPSIDIEYFSLKEKSIKKLHTDPIHIKVIGAKKQVLATEQNLPKRSETAATSQKASPTKVVRKDYALFWIGFVSGAIFMIFLGGIYLLWQRKRGFRVAFGSKKQLLMRLMPFISSNKEAASMAEALYEEIYHGKRSNVSKKEVERLLKNLMEGGGSSHPLP